MATAFADLYDNLRILLGDFEPNSVTSNRFSRDQLDELIRMSLRRVSAYAETSAGASTITPSIANDNDRLLILNYAALPVIQQRSRAQSYKTPVISASRGSAVEQVQKIEDEIYELESGGTVIISSDGSLREYLNAGDRLVDTINAALSE